MAEGYVKHTPGPWCTGGDFQCLIEANDRKTLVAECGGPLDDTPRNHAELMTIAQANARLISSAPDLLAALQTMVAVSRELYDMDMGDIGGEAVAALRADAERNAPS